MSIESPQECAEVDLPREYPDYSDVFSKTAATKLPPYPSWDCSVDLLPDAKMPKGRIYPLSVPEHMAMEEYIQEALHQGFIRPSSSLVSSRFFFVAKKGWRALITGILIRRW